MQTKCKHKFKFIDYRFKVLAFLIALVFPLFLFLYTLYDNRSYSMISIIFVMLALIPFLMMYEMKKPQAREWIPLAVMAALGAVGRVLFAPVPFFKPTSSIIIITASVFGPEAGFLTGAISALASNLFFGQGPWTPWQMFSWGFIGFISGYLIKKNILRTKLSICIFGCFVGFIYGWIMNIWVATGSLFEFSWQAFFGLYISSFIPDLTHSIATVIFLNLLYDSWGAKLRRIKMKFGLIDVK